MNERGIALGVTVMLLASLAVLGIWGARATLIDSRITQNYKESIRALYIAEAGIARAVDEIKNKGTSFNDILVGSDGLSGTKDDGILSFGVSIKFGGGIYSVKVIDNNDGDKNLFKDSDNRVIIISAGSVNGSVKNIEVGVEKTSTFLFDKALFADAGLTFTGSGKVDSYDSALGAYGNKNNAANGDIGTNSTSTSPAAVSLYDFFVVHGDAFIGPGGDTTSAFSLDGGSQITGTTSTLTSKKELPSISAPSGLPDRGFLTVPLYGEEYIGSSGSYSSINVQNGSDLIINGSGEIVIYAQKLIFNNTSKLYIDPAVSKVTIYTEAVTFNSSGVQLNASTGPKDIPLPSKLVVLGTDSMTICDFPLNFEFYGTFYAKNADITFAGNGTNIYGAIVGKTITVPKGEDVNFHYDEDLVNSNSTANVFKILSWREKWN